MPLFLKHIRKKNLIDNKEKNNKQDNNNKHTPPIKKKNVINKDIGNNYLKTSDDTSDKSIKNMDYCHNQLDMNKTKKSINNLDMNSSKKTDKLLNIDYQSIMKPNEFELNTLSYKVALKEDKRTFIQYYFSLLKTKHLFMFSFYPLNDYNSRVIKFISFFLYFTISYTVNALFFNDSTMHQIYEDEGEFNFIYQIPQILYSFMISSILNSLLKTLSLSEKNILEIKHYLNIQNLDKKAVEVLKCLSYKFMLFFIISSSFLLFSWYYLGCFCAVYVNTQIHLIKDTIISFGISLLYPVGLYIIPGIFRIPALRAKKQNKEIMYKFSKFIQLI